MKFIFQPPSVAARWAGFKHAHECDWHWPVQPIYPTTCGIAVRILPLCRLPFLFKSSSVSVTIPPCH